MKLMKVCLVLLITISMVSIYSVNALNDEFGYELLDNGTIEIQSYDGEEMSITIPSKIDGISVTSIGEDAFSYCETLISITIPKGIKNIGSSAFSDCTNLESISIPNSVTSIGDFAFYACNSLTSIKIPEKIKRIQEYTFSECSSLENVTIPSSVLSIEEGAFDCCSSLTTITIPNSVTKLGDYVFNDCTNLEEITIPKSVTSIGESAFSSCESLTDITILGNIKSILDYTFSDCISLKNITIPDSVTSIGEGAFENCSDLTSIIIPKSVTSIGEDAFYDCTQLTLKVYPNSYALKYAKENDIPYEIIPILATSVKLNETSLLLHMGDSTTLNAIITPSDVTDKTLVWSTSDSHIVSVDSNGKVTALSAGRATITVKTSNGKEAVCQVTVTDPHVNTPIASIKLNQTNLTLNKGNTYTLIGTLDPNDTTDSKVLSWSSDNIDIATVDSNGKVTAISEGQATITVKTSNGKEAVCMITVIDPIKVIPITSIKLNQTILALDEGNIYTLIGTINPDNTTDSKVLSWSSSDSRIVEVDSNGKVIALSEGQAIITVKTSNGLIATCTVIVSHSENNKFNNENNKTNLVVHKDKETMLVLKGVKTEDRANIITWLEGVTGSLITFVLLYRYTKKKRELD